MGATIGTEVRRHRERQGYSQEELARLAGLSTKTIWLVETDSSHERRGKTLRKIAEALGLDPTEFLDAAEVAS